ncbi:MAG: phage portal protein [Propionibacteriaceae bacterium]|jgi:hypothetical protein|nr:phage portal protein [Propionibacteriaceae bacterium]
MSKDTISDERATDIARSAAWGTWFNTKDRRKDLATIRDYYEGTAGIPKVAEGTVKEVRRLAEHSIENICKVVVDAFVRGMSVVGFRDGQAEENPAAWSIWQRQRLDARQVEAHRPALIYGSSYALVLPDVDDEATVVLYSPRFCHVKYATRRALFPQQAMFWAQAKVDQPATFILVDDTKVYEGQLEAAPQGLEGAIDGLSQAKITNEWEHGATYKGEPVCPVVKFTNDLDADGNHTVGEVEPLLKVQQAMNSVNFNRLTAARFAAFNQVVTVGWDTDGEQLITASSATWVNLPVDKNDFDLRNIPATPLAPFNELLEEMKEYVALLAAIPLYQATGNLSNVSTETAAMVEAAYQRKLDLKRESFGESWELVLRLAAEMDGVDVPSEATEVVWRETTSRSFGAVVDGITKIANLQPAQAEMLIELLDMVPGMTQQRLGAIRGVLKRAQAATVIEQVLAAPSLTPVEIVTEVDTTQVA